MRIVRAEDLDTLDETDLEVHEGHPVDLIVSVRLTRDESLRLTELAEREGKDVVDIMRAALDEYVSGRSQRAAN